MFSRVHQKLGTAGLVVAIVALVAAMTGGAFAAGGGHLTGKEKKEVKKIAKKFAGKKGKNGAPGATGPQGPKGDTGAAGAKGDTGAKGDKGDRGERGLEGSEGSPWTAGGVLPSEETETGVWGSPNSGVAGISFLPLSFPIRLAEPLELEDIHLINEAGEEVYADQTPPFAEHERSPSGCTGGSFTEPKADPGNLCVYTGYENQGRLFPKYFVLASVLYESSANGVDIPLQAAEGAEVVGSFAVTAP